MIAVMRAVTNQLLFARNYSFVSTVERTTAAYPEYMEVSVVGIWYAAYPEYTVKPLI